MADLDLYQGAYTGPQIDAALAKVVDMDATPTAGSNNTVSSGGVKSALDSLAFHTAYTRDGTKMYIAFNTVDSTIFGIHYCRQQNGYSPAFGTVMYVASGTVLSAFTTNAGTGSAITVTAELVTGGIELTFSAAYVRVLAIGSKEFTLSTTAPS